MSDCCKAQRQCRHSMWCQERDRVGYRCVQLAGHAGVHAFSMTPGQIRIWTTAIATR